MNEADSFHVDWHVDFLFGEVPVTVFACFSVELSFLSHPQELCVGYVCGVCVLTFSGQGLLMVLFSVGIISCLYQRASVPSMLSSRLGVAFV